MPNYTNIHNLSSDGEFLARFAAALAHYTSVVIDEDAATPKHAERLALALKVMDKPRQYAQELALAAAAKLGGAMPTDDQLDALVDGYWTILALNQPAPTTPAVPVVP